MIIIAILVILVIVYMINEGKNLKGQKIFLIKQFLVHLIFLMGSKEVEMKRFI